MPVTLLPAPGAPTWTLLQRATPREGLDRVLQSEGLSDCPGAPK